ncbi:hypothetical protein C8Q74DRAFT_1366079 [Fomes fomentarius]|nr:hypothetical protein C8Q74DRAFT_1366079 [Fomes fomentarius]
MGAATDDPQYTNQPRVPPDANHVEETQGRQQVSTPPGECNGTDSKTSRKREREVSLEPATPHAITQDIDLERPENKERRTPAKKNRTSDLVLEATQEETEDDVQLNGSPPHESKIRQISQGVEDIKWQNIKKDEGVENEPEQKMDEDPSAEGEGEHASRAQSETSKSTSTSDDATTPDTTLPPLLQGANPPILDDSACNGEDTGGAAGAEHPPESHVASAPRPSGAVFPSSSPVSTSPSDSEPSEKTHRLPSSRRSSDSDQEKGLKRKLGDRTVSESFVPGDNVPGKNGTVVVGATKRPRDDPEADPNTREKKRPTPPPEEDEQAEKMVQTPASVSPPKFGGFAAYASTSSPFASVQGPRIFGAKQPSTSSWASAGPISSPNAIGGPNVTSPFASTSTSPSPFAAAVAAKETSSSSAPQAHKRTGFEAFASSTSPFASAAKRPKSPPPSNTLLARSRSPSRHGTPARATSAFSAYAAGGAQSFAAPTPRRSPGSVFGESSSGNLMASSSSSVLDSGKEDEDSEKDSGVSFGERLRSSKDKEEEEASDEEKRLNLTEQEVTTGEEEEDSVYQVRGKLFTLSMQNQWKERGTGMLRLNVRREDGGGARLVMRKEAVYTVLLNAPLFKGMRCFLAQDPRYIRFSIIEAGATTHYNLRVSNAKIAQELLDEINARIPTE